MPLGDGPELIAFSPDPQAESQEAPSAEGAEGQQPQEGTAQAQAGQQTQAGQQGQTPPSGPPPRGPGQTQTAGPRPQGPGAQAQTAAQEAAGFRPFRERKAKPAPPPPPDAQPSQLVEEYGPGLHALKSRTTASLILCLPLLALALLDSGIFPVLDSLLPANLLLLASLALFLICGGLCLDVLREGLVQLTNLAPNGDTLAPLPRSLPWPTG